MTGDVVRIGESVLPVRLAMGWDDVALLLGDHLAVAVDGDARIELAA